MIAEDRVSHFRYGMGKVRKITGQTVIVRFDSGSVVAVSRQSLYRVGTNR